MATYSLIVKTEFFQSAVRNNAKSTKAKPVYIPRLNLRFTYGDGTKFERPAYERDEEDYKDAFELFKKSQTVITEGTPLADLPGITQVELATLKETGIVTVEGMSKSYLPNIEGLGERYVELRKWATGFLKQRKDMEKVFELQKIIEEKDLEIMRLNKEAEKVQTSSSKAEVDEPVGSVVAEDGDAFGAVKPKKVSSK